MATKTPSKKKTVLSAKNIKSVVKQVKEAISPTFTITIQIDAAVYRGHGATALEALQSVPTIPPDYISSGNVKVTKGDKVRDMFYSTPQLKRLLNPYNMEVLAHILTEGM